jgi:hypothetical protein
MADAFYTSALKKFADADIDLLVDTIKGVYVDAADYTFSASHDALDDIPAGGRVATTGALQNKTTTGGTFSFDPITNTGVSGDPTEYFILYKDSGVESTSWLICKHDVSFTPNGGDVTFTPNAAGHFSLGA